MKRTSPWVMMRGRHTAEVTVQYFDHPLVGEASNQDLFTAIFSAIEKMEKQAIKVRTKWRDTKRAPEKPATEPQAAAEPIAARRETVRRRRSTASRTTVATSR